ncbi:MAG: nucleotidyl transferase AbiEii/AbiGii toxin family protein [Armatimonadetes bacterium]|nr:nucleotidyl transferase AbiEii/AbiGii toxin family protein [Armatimonadota bacterium]
MKPPLSRSAATALRTVGPFFTERDFYLAGGTGLAVQLHHRRSVDLDWFSSVPLEHPESLGKALGEAAPDFVLSSIAQGTLHGRLAGTRISAFEYLYPLLSPCESNAEYKVFVASLLDIAAMKLLAIAQRGAKKDFIDIYALGTKMPLAGMVDGYMRKFGIADPVHLARALTYFDDANKETTPLILWDFDWRDVKREISVWVKRTFS